MKGKTEAEARKDLEGAGVKGEKQDKILPHKVCLFLMTKGFLKRYHRFVSPLFHLSLLFKCIILNNV